MSATATARSLFADHARASAIAQFNTFKSIEAFKFRKVPEFLFAGRANVGKSSLINALLGKNKLVRSSSKPGATKTLNFFAPGSAGSSEPQLYLVDGPGYGMRGRPEWGELFDEYTANRKRLCRVFVLISLIHGIKDSDKAVLESLHNLVLEKQSERDQAYPFSYQAIITKLDEWPVKKSRFDLDKAVNAIKQEIWDVAPTCLPEAILSSSKASIVYTPGEEPQKIGVDRLKLCIAEAGGFI